MSLGRPSRLLWRDRPWANTRMIRGIEGIAPPDVDLMRENLARLAHGQHAPLQIRQLPRGTYKALPVRESLIAGWCERLVVQATGGHHTIDETLAQQRRLPLDDLPFRATVGSDWMTFDFTHVLGDATTVWPFVVALCHNEELSEYFGTQSQARLPLALAVAHVFGRHPSQLISQILAEHPAMPVVAAPSQTNGPELPTPVEVVSVISSPGYAGQLRAARDERLERLSLVSIMMANAYSTASAQGLDVHPGMAVMANARRYLPPGTTVGSNFSVGTYLDLPEPSRAEKINERLTDHLQSGRPLLTMAAMVAGARKARVADDGWAPDNQCRTLMSFSHAGRLRWPENSEAMRKYAILGRPLGNHGLSVNVAEIDTRIAVSVSYYPEHTSRDVAHSVAKALAT